MIKNQSRKLWVAVVMLGLLAPCLHAQSTDTTSDATTNVVTGTDPEPISPYLTALLIVVGML